MLNAVFDRNIVTENDISFTEELYMKFIET